MKRKGITIWELYLERFVLGAAALFFIGFTAFQFMSDPNVVSDTSPGQIDDQLEREAESVRDQLVPGAAPTIDLPNYERLTARFDAALSPHAAMTLDLPLAYTAPGGEALDRPADADVQFHVPAFGAPGPLATRQYFGAIDPEIVSSVEALRDRFTEEPYDARWVTVYAVLPLQTYRDELAHPGVPGEASIPAAWHDNRVDMLDVIIEREERVDGEWTNLTTLDPLPGAYTFREILDGDPNKKDRDTMLSELAEPGVQERIVRPPFYDTIDDTWRTVDPRNEISGEEEAALSLDQRDLLRLERNLAQSETEKAEIEAELKELGAPPEPERPGRPGGERPGGAGGGAQPPGGGRAPGGQGAGGGRRPGGSGGGMAPPGGGLGGLTGGGSRGGGPSREEELRERQIKQLQRRWERVGRDVARIIRNIAEQREQMGLPPIGDESEDAVAVQANLMAGEDLLIWAHDLDVEPGHVYRYRARVSVHNPFFARALDLSPAQEDLAKKVSLATQASEWSAPIDVQPPTQLFITKAFPSRDGNLDRAVAEVYHYEGGRWWSSTFNIEPGMRIGHIKEPRSRGDAPRSIDFGTEWFVLDIVDDIDADADTRTDGLSGTVVLQRLGDPASIRIRLPMDDRNDDERLRLHDLVEDAEAALEVAMGS